KIWDVVIEDYRNGYSVTSAPLIVKDMVLIGVGGGEYGIRGFLDAYSIDDGKRLWRFHTIPGAGEPGNETWEGDSWKTGGAPTWLSGSYDPASNLLYWGTGNPGPLYQGDYRTGDNLYSDSVLALNPDTGELQWYFQFTPHDEHDWDSNQIPVLVDRPWKGKQRSLLLWPNRNGFFYVIDRLSGEFLAATAYAKQNWAERIDENGRPVVIESARPTPQGAVVFPAPQGASNWQSPTYSPRTDLLYVPAIDGGRIVFNQEDEIEHSPGAPFHGSMHQLISKDKPFLTTVRAIRPDTGDIAWEYQNPRRNIHWKAGGLLSTAGDIVFGGDGKNLFILNAGDGTELWRVNVGGYVNAVPVTYAVDGQQRLTMAAGRSLFTFGLAESASADLAEAHNDN
ncbi:MAG: PQQ-binding-like beta-propeller repeat protein, partial [Gammaproteobacteria bacterium]|nr:PQQ-binding-like beta-propeller repeat protein [Gammaproteobacteria bacterium]